MLISKFYADFSHTAVIPRVNTPIFHEITLREQVAGRLPSALRPAFLASAERGWELSKTLKEQKAPAEQRYDAWLRPFATILTEQDIRKDIEQHWERNPNFDWAVRQLAMISGHSPEKRLPLTFTSGAITPMIKIAMGMFFPELTSTVVDLGIHGVNIEMQDGVFTGNLLPIDPKVYAGTSAMQGEDFLMIGDHFMRKFGFGERLVVIYEEDGSCDQDSVMSQLSRYFP